MQKSYTANYLKIYLWQGISIILNLLSMFIVIPHLSDNPTIYGIYIVCISANIFLIYADIGFAGAGYKYASECFAQKNLEEEIKIVAFVGFVLFLFVVFFALTVSSIAFKPGLLIKNIRSATEINTASHLLLILAFFSPAIIFQRVLDIIYGVRLEQFVLQQIIIGASVLKILSVYYFFQNARYDIVGYFLFCQMVNVAALLFGAIIAKLKYEYKFSVFLKAFKFSKRMFNKTKALAFGSLFLTVTFILYYELDAFAIAKLLGPDSVAIYAVGFTVLTFMRTIFGALYSPFFARFNHFIGLNNIESLRRLYLSIVTLTLPLVVFPILSLFLLMDPFVKTWVGSHYKNSVPIAQLLIFCFIYGFISYPASFLIIAQERINILYVTAAIAPIIYWTGIVLTIHSLGLTSFALFKLIAMSLTGVIYFFITIKFLGFSPWDFARLVLGPAVIPIVFLCGTLLYCGQFMPQGKSTINLIAVVITGGASSAVALSLYYFFSSHFRSYAQKILKKCFA
jgi:O-antigen/teichoic acid export membrane protein